MTTAELLAAQDATDELRENVIAIELMLQRVGRRRSMSERHKSEVADHFGAKRDAVSGSKRLYAPNQPEIKRIASVLGEVREAWKYATIPYRRGIRLLRKGSLDEWQARFDELRDELAQALKAADENRDAILEASRAHLGDQLFDINDYPATFAGSVDISWGVHNFEPSEELLRLAPETYAREQERVRRQFEDAVVAFETESREQLDKLVGSLLDKLNGEDDPAREKKVVFLESAATNLREFFNRFDALNVRGDADLASLVDTARDALGNATMRDLKRSSTMRRSVAEKFKAVSDKLAELTIAAPVRSIDVDDLD